MTYFDKLKYDNFVNDTDGYFEKTRVINFGIIHKQVEEEQVEADLFKKYNTMDHSRLQLYPEKEKIETLSSAFRCSRKDIFLKKKHSGKNSRSSCQ